MQSKQLTWFSDIVNPDAPSLEGRGSYIDSLSGSSRSRLHIGAHRKYDRQKSNEPKNQHFDSVTKAHQTLRINDKSHVVDLDDTKWIEERKRKFPRLTDAQNSRTDLAPTNDQPELLIGNECSVKKGQGCNSIREQSRRRKTLYEKLME